MEQILYEKNARKNSHGEMWPLKKFVLSGSSDCGWTLCKSAAEKHTVDMTALVQRVSFELHLRKPLSAGDLLPLNLFSSFSLTHIHSKPRTKFDHVPPNSSVSESIQSMYNLWTHTCIFTHICLHNVCLVTELFTHLNAPHELLFGISATILIAFWAEPISI